MRRRLADQRGSTLVLAVGILVVASIGLATVVRATTSNERNSHYSKAQATAAALAEAGINNAVSILQNPLNNALQQATLPSSEGAASAQALLGGETRWWGVLTGSTWRVYGKGLVRNPNAGGPDVTRTLSADVPILPTLNQPLNNASWNYVFVKATNGSPCDLTLDNSVTIDASLFVMGDLCLDNSASVVRAPAPDLTNLVVGGNVLLRHPSSTIGTSAAPLNSVYVGGTCKFRSNPAHTPCSAADSVYANEIHATAPVATAPTADFDFWYANAGPGPAKWCTNASPGFVAPAPFEGGTFAQHSVRDGSAGTFDLTPSSSYDCRYEVDGNLVGQLKWDNATKTLTVTGVIYVDGDVRMSNNSTNEYQGKATLYVSGSFTQSGGQTRLCGRRSADACDFAGWDPNARMLGIVAAGDVDLSNGSYFQGALYADGTTSIDNSSQYDGPMITQGLVLENSVQAHEFPTIVSVPVGWPGNPTIYAEPQPPRDYSG